MAALTNLEVLSLSDNRLRTLPPLGALQKLRTLEVEGNFLYMLPQGITSLPHLERLTVRFNCIERLKKSEIERLAPFSFVASLDPDTCRQNYKYKNAFAMLRSWRDLRSVEDMLGDRSPQLPLLIP